jgi:hypothetical protein
MREILDMRARGEQPTNSMMAGIDDEVFEVPWEPDWAVAPEPHPVQS